jgi:hypothetical protein
MLQLAMQNDSNHFALRNTVISNNDIVPCAIRSINPAAAVLSCLGNGIDKLNKVTSSTGLSPKPAVYRILKALEDIMTVTPDSVSHRHYPGQLIHQISSNTETNHRYLTCYAFDDFRKLREYS